MVFPPGVLKLKDPSLIGYFVHCCSCFKKTQRKFKNNLLHDNDTFFGRSIAVNVINASACTADNLQIRCFDHFGCHFRSRAHNQAIIFLQCKYILQETFNITRMHSSRMRTARRSSRPGGGSGPDPPEFAPWVWAWI